MRAFQRDITARNTYQIARHNNTSSLMYDAFVRVVTTTDSSITALFTASGLRIPLNAADSLANFSSQGMFLLAMLYGDYLSGNETVPNTAVKTALKAGQVMAAWANKEKTTAADRDEALDQVMAIISRRPPSAADFRAVYNHVLHRMREISHDRTTFTRAQMVQVLDVQGDATFTLDLPDHLIKQKFEFIMLRGNGIPDDILAIDATRLIWRALQNRDNPNALVQIPDDVIVDPKDPAEREIAWRAWPRESKLAFFDVLANVRSNEVLRHGVMYALLSTLALTKSGNVTEQFITRRMTTLGPYIPGVDISNMLQPEMIQAFISHFPISNLSTDEVYGIIESHYTIFKQLRLEPLSWIIEQCAAANVTTAIQVAETFIKYPYAPYEILMPFFGDNQIKAWAKLVCNVVYDRFCSLSAPPVTMAEYADLAFVGTYVMFIVRAGRQTLAGTGYKGTPDNKARHAKDELIKVAQMILQSAQTALSSMTSIKSALQEVYDNATVVTAEDKYYVIPGNNLANDGNNPDHQRFDGALQNVLRADWPREMRRAPAGTIELNESEAVSQIRARLADNHANKHTAANLTILAMALCDASKQSLIDVIDQNRLNPKQRLRKLPDAVVAAARAFNVEIDDRWLVDPPAIAPIAPIADIHTNRFFRTWRPDVAAPPNPGPRLQQQGPQGPQQVPPPSPPPNRRGNN